MQHQELDFGKDRTIIGRVFNTPVTVKGATWLPLIQLILWGIMTRQASKRNPGSASIIHLTEGALSSAALLGPEWCHNLAHVYSADWIGKPMDELQILWGMPRCRYEQLNDQKVSPGQHIIRSLGGPVFNLLMIPVAFTARMLTRKGTIAREIARTALHTNIFLSTVSLLPIPGIDGAPILKWSLVDQGYEIDAADQIVQKVNGPLTGFLSLFSGWAFFKKKNLLGLLGGLLTLVSWGVFKGWLKEESIVNVGK
jgi:hypothetical protein